MATGIFSVFAVLAALVTIVCGVALLPALLVVGAVVLAFSLIAGALGLVFRLIGGVFVLLLLAPLMLAGVAVAFAIGVAILHAAAPLLLVIGIVWLIAHHHRAQSTATPSRV